MPKKVIIKNREFFIFDIFMQNFYANNKYYEHYFCNSCIKKWAKDGRNFCPLCRTTIRGVELGHIDDLVTHELTKEQNEAVKS